MSIKDISRNILRKRRHKRVRGKVTGTAKIPRLNVFFSLRYVIVQLIDDGMNKVLVQAHSKNLKGAEGKNNIAVAEEIGKIIAEKAQKIGLEKVVFDRGGYKYHGKVKALAEAARKAGLAF